MSCLSGSRLILRPIDQRDHILEPNNATKSTNPGYPSSASTPNQMLCDDRSPLNSPYCVGWLYALYAGLYALNPTPVSGFASAISRAMTQKWRRPAAELSRSDSLALIVFILSPNACGM